MLDMEDSQMNLNEMYARIGEYIQSHDSETYSQIAASLGLSRSQVSRVARRLGIRRGAGRSTAALEAAVKAIEAAGHNPHCASTSEVASVPMEIISIEPDAPLAGETLSVTADTALVETAVL
jgi:hypothetical protein